LSKHRADEIKFIPPQLYEFNRISKFKELAQFSEFSLRCQQRGLTYWLPKFSSDGVIGLLPGSLSFNLKIIKNEKCGKELRLLLLILKCVDLCFLDYDPTGFKLNEYFFFRGLHVRRVG
jgi:hypothetical protein